MNEQDIAIDFNTISQFIISYYKKCPKHIRLGQHFCNTFEITDPDLFYQVDDKVSITIINEKYGTL